VVVFDGFVTDCFEDDYQLFRGTHCFNLQGTSRLKMEAVDSSIMTNTPQITPHQNAGSMET
jgi:hypothetical protein